MEEDLEQRGEFNTEVSQEISSTSIDDAKIKQEDQPSIPPEDVDAISEKSASNLDSFDEKKTDTSDNKFEEIEVSNLGVMCDEETSLPDLNIEYTKENFSDIKGKKCLADSKPAVEDVKDDVFITPSLHKTDTECRQRHLRENINKKEESIPTREDDDFVQFKERKNVEDVFVANDVDSTPIPQNQYLNKAQSSKKLSIFKYFMAEVCHGYVLELDEDKYDDKRRIVYTFMKIPREVEKLLIFGFMLCLDCFLFMFTFLPVRVLIALWRLLSGVFCCKKKRLLEPTQICDLLKASIIVVCCCLLEYVDFSVMYHTVRGQSVIKLYVIYNMLEVADRLFSSFGQDILDALFWTATEPRDRKRQHVGTLPHFALGVLYVFLHAVLVLFQATCLNVAVNSHNKALLVILVSNQFVELKGSVFKRFERNNLFQMACSDIRERFHYLILVSIVLLRNLTEFNWNLEHLHVISPYLLATVLSEYFVDWVKHAFITKFNGIQPEVYREYRSRLAKDATSSRQKNAHADHFDLVSRRMGFIPLPLGSLVIRVVRHSIHISGMGAFALLITTYIFLMSVKILNSIIFLGKASEYSQEYPSTEPKPKDQPKTQSTTQHSQQKSHDQSTMSGNVPGENKKEEKKPTKSLAEIDRYTLCSKEIVLF